MQINEPVTTFTNYILSALTLFFAVRLYSMWQSSHELPVLLWIGAFIALGISALAAGTKHGFEHRLGTRTVALIWKITVYALGISVFFVLSATVLAFFPRPLAWWLVGAGAIKLVVYIVWMSLHDDYIYVILDYAPTMLVVMLLSAYAAVTSGGSHYWWIVGGVAITFLAAGVQRSKFTLHRHFNHNDLYHVIQMIALWMFYVGVSGLTMLPGT